MIFNFFQVLFHFYTKEEEEMEKVEEEEGERNEEEEDEIKKR